MSRQDELTAFSRMMQHRVNPDRNKTPPKCRLCPYYHPDFKYRRCFYATCPYGKPDSEVFRQKPLQRDKLSKLGVVR